MNLIYASLLLHSAGKDITEENVKKIADATGVAVEHAQIKALVAALKDVNIAEAISKAAMPVAVAAPAASAAPAAAKDEGPSAEELEKKSEEAAAGLSALFG
ncbi:MAG: 50S ribosomal protein P1 [Candidatus Aenigmarchaeota archaeon]|nr:50S ribosomal protein P1 [Candidatus Aenigmarchaeota archaeon]